jgi:hypothetical protein
MHRSGFVCVAVSEGICDVLGTDTKKTCAPSSTPTKSQTSILSRFTTPPVARPPFWTTLQFVKLLHVLIKPHVAPP